MTRGKLYFIEHGNNIYRTVEFNGDMYPEGHGAEIILAYKNGLMKNRVLFEDYARGFDERKFGYTEETGKDVVELFSKGESEILDFTKNHTDYLYVVNESGRSYILLTEEGEKTLQNGQLAVMRFQKLDFVIEKPKINAERSWNQLMEITMTELYEHIDDDDFLLKYGNPMTCEYGNKKYVVMAMELYERLVKNV